MKNLIFALVVFGGQSIFASTQFVPNEFMAAKPVPAKMKSADTTEEFAENVDHMMSVQHNSLEKVSSDHRKIHLTQLVTSFSVTKSGLFGLSALSAGSTTNLFWNKKKALAKTDDVKSFTIAADEDELSLQMKVDDVVDYLVKQDKVKDPAQLRINLDTAMRKGNEIFNDIANLETPNWRVGGYRLDLAIGASGVVAPFTKVGENVRLWIEWTKPAKPNAAAPSNSKVTHFVSKVLADTEFATAKMNMPHFELQNIFIGLGEDIKAGLFGFGSSTFGFVGYVKFVKKPKAELTNAMIAADSIDEDYTVVHESSKNKSLIKFVVIPRKEIIKGIQRSLKFAQFFANKADRIQSTNWELGLIRETATITRSGLFGLSNLSTKGVFVFNFTRIQPHQIAPIQTLDESTYMSLIRLSFVTVLGYTIPGIANFVARPNIEFFWK
jgi:hypothetical protein